MASISVMMVENVARRIEYHVDRKRRTATPKRLQTPQQTPQQRQNETPLQTPVQTHVEMPVFYGPKLYSQVVPPKIPTPAKSTLKKTPTLLTSTPTLPPPRTTWKTPQRTFRKKKPTPQRSTRKMTLLSTGKKTSPMTTIPTMNRFLVLTTPMPTTAAPRPTPATRRRTTMTQKQKTAAPTTPTPTHTPPTLDATTTPTSTDAPTIPDAPTTPRPAPTPTIPTRLVETDSRYFLSTDREYLKLYGGGNDIPTFCKSSRPINVIEAADILEQRIGVTNLPAAGTMYLFFDSDDEMSGGWLHVETKW